MLKVCIKQFSKKASLLSPNHKQASFGTAVFIAVGSIFTSIID